MCSKSFDGSSWFWIFCLLVATVKVVVGAELKFRIPQEAAAGSSAGVFRVSYGPSSPPGPASNFTVDASLLNQLVTIGDLLPGTLYTFRLFTEGDPTPLWTSELPTTPEPPTNLSVSVMGGKVAEAGWGPPRSGGHTGYKLSLVSEGAPPRNHYISQGAPFLLRDLTPGAPYHLQLYSVFHGQDSATSLATNFTTKPNTPGRFIVWFRNETTLLVLWQPPYPSGVFDRYRVAVAPPDAARSELEVAKERDPPGPAQAAFYGLVPGRAYNISVQTVSEDQESEPTRAQYRTVPLPPVNVTWDPTRLSSTSFYVRWDPPGGQSEFDRYQVALGIRNTVRYLVGKEEERAVSFEEGLDPGDTYEVVVKTVSGNVASWPATANITTRPLPVTITGSSSEQVGEISLSWEPAKNSTQDSYKIKYNDMEAFNSGGSLLVVRNTSITLTSLLPGRNYSVSVSAVSKRVPSEGATVYQPTKPSSPVIELLTPSAPDGSTWNLTWKSDVTSRQDQYSVVYVRSDTRSLHERLTFRSWMELTDLYPGASYELKVYAISFNLWSEPHSYFHTIPPRKPRALQVVKASGTNMIVVWTAPSGSLYDHFNVRYQPVGSAFWREMGFVNTTSCEIKDLVPGERYSVQVTSVSKKVESLEAEEIEQAMYPKPLGRVRERLDSYNVTFEWEVPEGHRDYYIIMYNPIDDPSDQKSLQVAANDTKPHETMDVIIDDLKPGELYSFRFYAVSNNLRSEAVTVQTRTKPVIDSVINVVTREQEPRTLGIKYTPTPRRSAVFDRYRFQLSGTDGAQEKLFNDSNRLVLFDHLVPGRLYDILIWTVSGGVSSEPIHRQTRLYPEPISEIVTESVSDTEIVVSWSRPEGEMDGYEIQYQEPGGGLVQNVSFAERNSFARLRPHHDYTFLVAVVAGLDTATARRSRPLSKTIRTLEAVPGRVHVFRAVEVKPSEVTLQWNLPQDQQNGVLTGFKVTYYIKGSKNRRHEYFEPTENKGVIHGLQPGMDYVFEIQARTKIGAGSIVTSEEATPIWAPPVPDPSVAPKVVGRGARTVRVEFGSHLFSEAHGRVLAYTLIVAEDPTADASALTLPSWADVQQYDVWPPYQVQDPFFPFNHSLVADFVVGGESCSGVKGYCNGPLKPASAYRVKLRAFTTPTAFTDTAFSVPVHTESDHRTLLASIFVPLLLLLVLAAALALLWRRRRPFAKKAKHAKPDAMSIAESEIVTSRCIKLKDFADHYRLMSADSDFRFSEEFELLKGVGRERACLAADLPANRPKNRFTNILPYDHSRVKLMPTDDEEGTDYINANYIPGHNGPREFIVTQGPLHSTRDDFWRMVWEQGARAIVMLTRCVEKGREKCDRYWPSDTQPAYYGDIQVSLLNESHYHHWTIAEFKVARNEQSRVLKHFHFTTWPDFGVPEPPQVLVKFVRTFRERVGTDPKPIVVHCSAGVGRSGTFIALDRVLQHIQKHDSADIFGIVHEMRRERVWMVQNEQQYICIHQCLQCVLEKKEDTQEIGRAEAHDNQAYDDDEGIAESGM